MTTVLYALTLLVFSWIKPIPVLAAPEVIIGYANISARVSPLWIAQERGFFAKYGVAVQPVYMPGSPVMIASLSTGQIQLANSGGTAALGAAAGGLDLKVIGTFTSRIPFDLVVRPTVKNAQDLRGKRLGVQVIGGTIWMGAMLGLEHLGLDPRRDAIQIVAAGDQTMLIQALEKGTVDATVVDSAFSNGLKQRGFSILVELSKTNIPFCQQRHRRQGKLSSTANRCRQKCLESLAGRSRLRAQPQDEIFGFRDHHETPENQRPGACDARL